MWAHKLFLVPLSLLWLFSLIYPKSILAKTISIDTTTDTNIITVSVDSVYKVDFYKSSSTYYALFFDKAQNNTTPNETFAIIGPQIKDATIKYRFRFDTDRKISVLENTPTRVKIRVKGKFSKELSLTYLTDDAGSDAIELIEDYVFTPDGFNVYQQWDFKNGLSLDGTSDIENGLSWLYLQLGETTGSHSDTIFYGDSSTESSLATKTSFANTNTYVVNQGLSTYQDYFIGIGETGWLDFSGIGTSDYYYWPNFSSDLDLIRIREMNDTISGKHYSNWYMRFFAQVDLDTTTKREAINNDLRNPDNLSDGLTTGTGWDFTLAGTNVSGGDYFNQYENAYLLQANSSSQLEYELDGDIYSRYKPYINYRNYRSNTLPTPMSLEGSILSSGTNYNIDYKPISTSYFLNKLTHYSSLQSTTSEIGANFVNNGCTFVAAKYGNGAECSASNADTYTSITEGTDYQKGKGALSFWFKPLYNSDSGIASQLFSLYGDSTNAIQMLHTSTNILSYKINTNGTESIYQVAAVDYNWKANDWIHILVEWDDTEALATQQRLYINGIEPTHTDSAVDFNSTAFVTNPYRLYLSLNTVVANAVFDEVYLYDSDVAQTQLSVGGDTSSASEYLADATNDYTFAFTSIDASSRGQYVFIGSDSQFQGLNVDLATLGVSSDASFGWDYWNGTVWSSLSVTDTDTGSSKFTASGNFYWTAPSDWTKYSMDTNPDVYYIRGKLSSGSYSTQPIENLIYPDIVLFQYLGNITTANQTFRIPSIDPSLSFSVSGVGDNTITNGITTNIASAYSAINFSHLNTGSVSYAAHQLQVTTNANYGYVVYVKLNSYLQGIYSGNNIDPFATVGVSWTTPLAWVSPTGTTPNIDTGWIGANTSDTRVPGWSNASAKFGPITTSNNPVMYSSTQDTAGSSIYVTYAIEVNNYQPADSYSGVLMYTLLPRY